jgi:glycosyltransferase involved in cell wall biosynthesis
MRTAIVHDWFITYGGAERTFEQMLKVFPDADLFALYDFIPQEERGWLQDKTVTTSFLQKLPGARNGYRNHLPLMPLAVEQFDLSGYGLVISSSFAVAKGVITGPDQLHVAYVYSPMRYAWDMTHQYLNQTGLNSGIRGWFVKWRLHRIRQWDARTAHGPDLMIAISDFVARRIEKVYGRKSRVIYPPVDIDRFSLRKDREEYYLTASRMVPYKRIDMIVEAFLNMPERKLVVIGDGPEFKKAKRIARGRPNIELLGYQSDEVLREKMQSARAFVFAAREDFGIIPLEAQACGTPVIAFGGGGAMETVVDGETGVFFEDQTPESLCETVERFEQMRQTFNPERIRANALRFSAERFREEFGTAVNDAMQKFQRGEFVRD